MQSYFWIALGSALGGMGRHWCAVFFARHLSDNFPWGTLFVNIVGSLLIGLFATLTAPSLLVSPTARQFFMIGVFGGFTTFSSFSLQTLMFIQADAWLQATLYIIASIVLCLVGVWCGYLLGVAINR